MRGIHIHNVEDYPKAETLSQKQSLYTSKYLYTEVLMFCLFIHLYYDCATSLFIFPIMAINKLKLRYPKVTAGKP